MNKEYLAFALRQRGNRRGLRRKPPKWQPPAALERKYRKLLNGLLVDFFASVKAELLAALPSIVEEFRQDSWVDSVNRAIGRIRMTQLNLSETARQIAAGMGQDIADFNKGQFRQVMRATIGVDVVRAEPWLESQIQSWAAENVTLIQSLPGQSLTSIEGLAQRGVRSGASASDIADQIEAQFDTTRARANLIARDQVATLNGDLTERRQTDLGITMYYWEGSRDERQRESHRVLNGKLCQWEDSSVYSEDGGETWKSRSSIGGYIGDPGEDFQCRCTASPEIEGLLKSLGI